MQVVNMSASIVPEVHSLVQGTEQVVSINHLMSVGATVENADVILVMVLLNQSAHNLFMHPRLRFTSDLHPFLAGWSDIY